MSKIAFENPPLTETVLSLQFDSLEKLKMAHLGLVWAVFRDRFPSVEEQHELPPNIEQFGTKQYSSHHVRLEFVESPFSGRLWFLNEPGGELLQVQKDRFIRNWRKRNGESYPRYDVLRSRFVNDFEIFKQFIESESLGEIRPNQCELTYVNVIRLSKTGEFPRGLGDVLKLFQPNHDVNLPGFEDASITARYLLKKSSDPIGRIYLEALPAIKTTDDSAAVRLNLTARGRPLGDGLDGVLQFFDYAHDSLVQCFSEVTTDQLHEIWGRQS